MVELEELKVWVGGAVYQEATPQCLRLLCLDAVG